MATKKKASTKKRDHIAKVSATIDAGAAVVWDALVNPKTIKKYMFGTKVVSDFKKGSDIRWKGEWEGRKYEDKGVILAVDPERRLQYSHFSPLGGEPDKPSNYHIVTIDLAASGKKTKVTLSQNKNPTIEARKHSEKNWKMMLEGLKKLLEA